MLIDPTRSILPTFGTAWVLAWLFNLVVARQESAENLRRWIDLRYGVALASATCLGVLLIQGQPGWPTKFWHWVWPVGCVGLFAKSILAMLPTRSNRSRSIDAACLVTVWLVAAAVASWMLVPTWSTLSPGRLTVGTILVGYLAALTIAFDKASSTTRPDPEQILPTNCSYQLVVAITATGFCLAAAIAANASLKYGELTAAIAAAVAGCLAANGWRNTENRALEPLIPVASMLVGSAAFVGVIYPQEPLLRLLPLPFAPMAIPVCVRLFPTNSRRDINLRYAVFFSVLVALTLMAVV